MKKFLALLIAVLVFGCLSTQDAGRSNLDNKKISIKKIDVMIDNIDHTYWNKKLEDRSLFYNFYVYYNESDLTASDIALFKIESENDINWTIDANEYFHPDSKYIGGTGRWYDSRISNNGSVLMLKNLKLIIKLKNNFNLSADFSLNSPDNYDSTNTYAYNEDYKGEKNENYINAIKRAKIINKEKLENSLKIEFSVDDNRIKTGELWFYNKDNKFIGEAKNNFINEFSKELANYLNEGKGMNTAGEVNIINIKNENIDYADRNFKFEDINYAHIILKDGNYKYDGKLKNTIYRSISERIIF